MARAPGRRHLPGDALGVVAGPGGARRGRPRGRRTPDGRGAGQGAAAARQPSPDGPGARPQHRHRRPAVAAAAPRTTPPRPPVRLSRRLRPFPGWDTGRHDAAHLGRPARPAPARRAVGRGDLHAPALRHLRTRPHRRRARRARRPRDDPGQRPQDLPRRRRAADDHRLRDPARREAQPLQRDGPLVPVRRRGLPLRRGLPGGRDRRAERGRGPDPDGLLAGRRDRGGADRARHRLRPGGAGLRRRRRHAGGGGARGRRPDPRGRRHAGRDDRRRAQGRRGRRARTSR